MSDNTENFDVGMDISDVVSASAKLASVLVEQKRVVEDLADTYVKSGGDTEKYEQALERLSEVFARVREATKELRSEGKAANVLAKEQDQLTRIYTKSLDEQDKAMRKVQEASRLMAEAKDRAVGTRGASRSDLAEVERLKREAAARVAQAQGSAFGSSVASAFPVPSGASVSAIAAFESALSRLTQTATKSKIPLNELQQMFAQLRANPANTFKNLTPDLANVQSSILGVVNAYKKVVDSATQAGEAGRKSGQLVTISWQGVVRLLESQIIRRGFITLVTDIRSSINEFIQLQQQIAQLDAISRGSDSTIKGWGDSIKAVSDKFAKTQADVAGAAFAALGSQVVKDIEDFNRLSDTIGKFSLVTRSTATESATLLTNTLNQFHLDADAADKVAKILFGTFEGGRVKVSEMAQDFGRVGAVAAQFGISLNETAVVLNALTRNGLRFADASRSIEQIISGVIHPTDELQRVFERVGLASGKDALEIVGLTGVLNILNQESLKGGNRLGELERSFRTIRNTVTLTGKGFIDLKEAQDEAAASAERYEKAQQNAKNAPGFNFSEELEKIKSFFTNDVASAVVKTIEEISAPFGGFSELVKKITTDVGALARETITLGGAFGSVGSVVRFVIEHFKELLILYGSYKVTLAAISVATKIQESYTRALAIAEQQKAAAAASSAIAIGADATATSILGINSATATPRVIALATAMKSFLLSTGVGLAVAGVALLVEKLATAKSAAEEAAEAIDKLRLDREKADEATVAEQRKNLADVKEADKKAIDERISAYLRYANAVVTGSKQILDEERKNLKEVEDLAKVQAKGLTDIIQQNIRDINSRASSFHRISEDTGKDIVKLGNLVQDSIEKARLKYATEYQQIEILRNKDFALQEEQSRSLAIGSKEELENARKINSDRIKLAEQRWQVETTLAKQNFDAQVKAGNVSPTFDPVTGQQRYIFTANTVKLEEELNRIKQEGIAIDLRIRAIAQQREAEQRALAAQEEARLRRIQDLLRQAGNFNPFDNKGKLKPDFKEDPTKALENFQKIIDEIGKLGGKDAISAVAALTQEKMQLARTIAAELARQDAENAKETIKRDRDLAIQKIQVARDLSQKLKEELQKRANDVTDYLNKVEVEAQKAKPNAILTFLPDPLGTGVNDKNIEKFKNFEQVSQTAHKLAIDLENLKNLAASGGNINEIFDKLIDLKNQSKDLAKDLPTGSILGDDLLKFNRALNEMELNLKRQSNAAREIESAKAALGDLGSSIDLIPEKYRNIDTTGNQMAVNQKKNFSDLASEVNNLVGKLKEVQNAMESLSNTKVTVPLNIPAPPAAPAFREEGGPIGFSDGPRGGDVIPAWLSRGEMVMNPSATSQWYPQLMAMNKGMKPQYFSQGGPVTNVGDVNVTVQGGGSNESTARDLARAIRRELRRGTLTIN